MDKELDTQSDSSGVYYYVGYVDWHLMIITLPHIHVASNKLQYYNNKNQHTISNFLIHNSTASTYRHVKHYQPGWQYVKIIKNT